MAKSPEDWHFIKSCFSSDELQEDKADYSCKLHIDGSFALTGKLLRFLCASPQS